MGGRTDEIRSMVRPLAALFNRVFVLSEAKAEISAGGSGGRF